MILVDIIAGARPNFMKVAPIINAIKKSQRNGSAGSGDRKSKG